VISLPLGFLIVFLDLYVAFNPSLGDWGASSLILPFVIYFVLVGLLVIWRRPQIAKRLAIGGLWSPCCRTAARARLLRASWT
jgi:hypothetical protein